MTVGRHVHNHVRCGNNGLVNSLNSVEYGDDRAGVINHYGRRGNNREGNRVERVPERKNDNAVAYQKPNAVVSLDFDRPAPAATATETAEAPSRCPP